MKTLAVVRQEFLEFWIHGKQDLLTFCVSGCIKVEKYNSLRFLDVMITKIDIRMSIHTITLDNNIELRKLLYGVP